MVATLNDCAPIRECIACSHDIEPIIDLGAQPLANSFKTHVDEEQTSYPLAINRCTRCNHVQLSHKVSPDLLFKNYLYVSGTSQTQRNYFRWFARYAREQKTNNFHNNVLDIGCNDGSQLDAFKKLDPSLNTFGIDPAENLHPLSSRNHNTLCAFFTGEEFGNMKFDTIVCQNAFPHNYNQNLFLQNARKVMHENSRLFITTSQADMILNGEFDTIYHEHLSFYNIKSMANVCRYAGLRLIDVVKHPIHGTSFIFVIATNDLRPAHVENLIEMERLSGLHSSETYKKYATRCFETVERLRSTVYNIQKEMPVIGFGAAAKGNTLMNWAQLKPDVVIDENPLKQGLFTPGMSVQVGSLDYLAEKYMKSEKVCFLPLAWNFYDEIVTKIKSVRPTHKDVFIRYFPDVQVLV